MSLEITCFTKDNLHALYDQLAVTNSQFREIIDSYDYPPLWIRPNSFETLVLTILEQQVSLASAYAAYQKLKERIDISPANLLSLTDEELRACYFSRQKIAYTRELASAILSKKIGLKKFESLPDDQVRQSLIALKGIGNWTVDIYLLHALRRTDVFPTGDIALVNAIKMVHELNSITREEMLAMAEPWRPYRSMATMLYWHYYIKKKNIRLIH